MNSQLFLVISWVCGILYLAAATGMLHYGARYLRLVSPVHATCLWGMAVGIGLFGIALIFDGGANHATAQAINVAAHPFILISLFSLILISKRKLEKSKL